MTDWIGPAIIQRSFVHIAIYLVGPRRGDGADAQRSRHWRSARPRFSVGVPVGHVLSR